RRIIARVDRVREKLLFGPGPELADVLVGLDRLVPELEAVFGPLGADTTDVDGTDDVAEMIELDRSARGIAKIDRSPRVHELLLIVALAVDRLERGIDHLAIHVNPGSIETGNGVEILQYAVDETLVAVALEIERVGRAGDKADRLLAVALEQRV